MTLPRSGQQGRDGTHWPTLIVVIILTIAGLIFAGRIHNRLEDETAAVTAGASDAATRAATETVRYIQERVNRLKDVARHLADEISTGEITYEELAEHLETTLRSGENISVTVGYFPEYAPELIETVPDAAIYFTVGYKNDTALDVSSNFYTNELVANKEQGNISEWYDSARQKDKEDWFGAPYYSPVTRTWWMGGYSVPFHIDGAVAGVVAAELTLEQARHAMFLASVNSFGDLSIDSNFGLLISGSGQIISHPDRSFVEEQRHVSDFIPAITDMSKVRGLPLVSNAESDTEIYLYDGFYYARSGQTLSIYFAPVADTGWWAAIALDKTVIEKSSDNVMKNRRTRVEQALAVLTFVFGLTLLVLRVDKRTTGRLWIASIAFALLCISAVGYLLWLTIVTDLNFDPKDVVLKNRAVPAKVQIQYQEQEKRHFISIPTGVFVQSAEFSSANDVTITGFIWQRYDHSLPGWLQPNPSDPKPGFVLPESEFTDVQFAYQRDEDSHKVYGWYFNAVLRQEFDYQHYPFDLENIWIRMWHREIGKGVILTPDLVAYDSLIPEQKPGLEMQDFVLEGWDIVASFFSYRLNNYNTNLGIGDHSGLRNSPELYFNISLKRNFINAFIMNFITLAVVAFLLFAVLLTIRVQRSSASLLGFNVSGVLGFCAALFFVVILAHTSLRETLAAQRLVYLEYYYFIMYGAFITVSVNAILVASEVKLRLIRYGDNAVSRLLYWPMVGLSLLVITLFTFF